MLKALCLLILVVWFAAFVTGHTLGGFIHLLLLQVLILVYVQFLEGHKPL
jgi:hypothetical protein